MIAMAPSPNGLASRPSQVARSRRDPSRAACRRGRLLDDCASPGVSSRAPELGGERLGRFWQEKKPMSDGAETWSQIFGAGLPEFEVRAWTEAEPSFAPVSDPSMLARDAAS